VLLALEPDEEGEREDECELDGVARDAGSELREQRRRHDGSVSVSVGDVSLRNLVVRRTDRGALLHDHGPHVRGKRVDRRPLELAIVGGDRREFAPLAFSQDDGVGGAFHRDAGVEEAAMHRTANRSVFRWRTAERLEEVLERGHEFRPLLRVALEEALQLGIADVPRRRSVASLTVDACFGAGAERVKRG
jgi:hypothetical protein